MKIETRVWFKNTEYTIFYFDDNTCAGFYPSIPTWSDENEKGCWVLKGPTWRPGKYGEMHGEKAISYIVEHGPLFSDG